MEGKGEADPTQQPADGIHGTAGDDQCPDHREHDTDAGAAPRVDGAWDRSGHRPERKVHNGEGHSRGSQTPGKPSAPCGCPLS
jgi:hypothetical protein